MREGIAVLMGKEYKDNRTVHTCGLGILTHCSFTYCPFIADPYRYVSSIYRRRIRPEVGLEFARRLTETLCECNPFKRNCNSTSELIGAITCNTAVICPDACPAALKVHLPFRTLSCLQSIYIAYLH